MAKKPLQTQCPPKLAEVIDLVNIFPPGMRLPALSVRSRLAIFEGDEAKEDEAEWTMRARCSLYECLKEAPDDFRQFIYGDPGLHTPSLVEEHSPALFDNTFNAVKRYEDFAQLRAKLLRLIRFIKSHDLQWRANSQRVDVSLPLLFTPVLGERGFIRVGGDMLLEALRDVEANRVKECADCKRIFWATYKNKLYCDSQCANRRRVRKSRLLKTEKAAEYKANRILKKKGTKRRSG
jgi:hypothetical protein